MHTEVHETLHEDVHTHTHTLRPWTISFKVSQLPRVKLATDYRVMSNAIGLVRAVYNCQRHQGCLHFKVSNLLPNFVG